MWGVGVLGQTSPTTVKSPCQGQTWGSVAAYGSATRITNDDNVDFNASPKDIPIDTAFAEMNDPTGMVGWGILGPGTV